MKFDKIGFFDEAVCASGMFDDAAGTYLSAKLINDLRCKLVLGDPSLHLVCRGSLCARNEGNESACRDQAEIQSRTRSDVCVFISYKQSSNRLYGLIIGKVNPNRRGNVPFWRY